MKGAGLGGPVVTLLLVVLLLGGAFVLLDQELGQSLFRITSGVSSSSWGSGAPAPTTASGNSSGSGCNCNSSNSSSGSSSGAGWESDAAADSQSDPRAEVDGTQGVGDSSAGGIRSLKPAGVALYSFIFFSAYRLNGTTLYVLGMVASLVLNGAKPEFLCEWHPGGSADGIASNSSSITGGAAGTTSLPPPPPAPGLTTVARVLPASTTTFAHLPYTEVELECAFPAAVGADARGGALALTVRAAPQAGETLTLRQHNEPVVVARVTALREPAGHNATAAAAQPLRYKYAFCSAPISGATRPALLREWFIYHLALYNQPSQQQPDGSPSGAHFYLYNVGGLDARGRAVLAPLVAAGLVTVWDTLEQPRYPAWWTSQILFMNDCVHRNRFLAEWVVFHDFDEFVYVAPPHSLAGILADYAANSSAAMLTFGSWEIDVGACAPPPPEPRNTSQSWPLERMRWRVAQPECRHPAPRQDAFTCSGAQARRKYMLNPRKEVTVSVHLTLGDSYDRAVHLHARVARLEHYRGIFSAGRRPCAYARTSADSAAGRYAATKSPLEMECAVCAMVPRAMAYVASLLGGTDFLANSTTLAD